jgi:hypothetical protein
MCKWGTDGEARYLVSPSASHSGEAYWKTGKVDACIAPIITALNAHGIYTEGCCCGHGKADGTIWLTDGRVMSIRCITDEEYAQMQRQSP